MKSVDNVPIKEVWSDNEFPRFVSLASRKQYIDVWREIWRKQYRSNVTSKLLNHQLTNNKKAQDVCRKTMFSKIVSLNHSLARLPFETLLLCSCARLRKPKEVSICYSVSLVTILRYHSYIRCACMCYIVRDSLDTYCPAAGKLFLEVYLDIHVNIFALICAVNTVQSSHACLTG